MVYNQLKNGMTAIMGVDLIGWNPSSDIGKGLYCNWSAWTLLANYAIEIAPRITSRCQYWMYNEGDGLNALAARALADILENEIDSGRCEATLRIRRTRLDAMQAQIDAMPK
jgi:hypothetical protein